MEQLKTGWLAPDGTFIYCKTQDHFYMANEIAEKYGYLQPLGISVDDLIMNYGWVHISISTFLSHEWHIWWNKPLTEYQKNFLRPYFEESEIPVSIGAQACWERELLI